MRSACSKAACVALLLSYALLTFRYGSVWQNELTLWTWAANHAPRKPRPQVNLALALMERRQFVEAWSLLDRVDQQIADDTMIPAWDRREAVDAVRQNRLVMARVMPR